ncbi:hypothetical protein LPMP_311890 [Leishmania panamensis]|uniref:CRAL-TRIO domain-containing protein n=1 Tax=Leishmania panamensis TaxID=5679 RepID=A0A088RZR9_LEIPA|nr:hypothetical protein LPMP_311890 [Leishmania panamensis]AIO00780.1 hypothetical protein LPMP_311890 [Leishmania panamensis]
MVTSRYPVLTADQEKKVTELIKVMKEKYDPLPPLLLALQRYTPEVAGNASDDAAPGTFFSPIRNYCYRFLTSRRWDLQMAFEMMQLSVSYREENALDSRAELPSAVSCRGWDQEEVRAALDKPTRPTNQRLDRLSTGIAQYFTLGLHYWDKYGQPVVYLNLGSIDESGLLKKLEQLANVGQTPDLVMWELVQHLIGVQEQLLFYQQMQYTAGKLNAEADDGLIRSSTIVVDLHGLTFTMLRKAALDLFAKTLRTLFQYYPQCVHQILVVNSPAMVMFAYNIVRVAFSPAMHEKLRLISAADTPATMKDFIDAQFVPDYLGGLCHCEGGCIGGYDLHLKKMTKDDGSAKNNASSSAQSSDQNDEVDVTTEDITLRPGEELKRSFSLKKGESVVWEFASANGHDVAFTRYFVPEKEVPSIDTSTLPTTKLKSYVVFQGSLSEGLDKYTASDDGLFVIMWGNNNSWFTVKRLQLNVFKQAATLMRVEQAAEACENEKRAHIRM